MQLHTLYSSMPSRYWGTHYREGFPCKEIPGLHANKARTCRLALQTIIMTMSAILHTTQILHMRLVIHCCTRRLLHAGASKCIPGATRYTSACLAAGLHTGYKR